MTMLDYIARNYLGAGYCAVFSKRCWRAQLSRSARRYKIFRALSRRNSGPPPLTLSLSKKLFETFRYAAASFTGMKSLVGCPADGVAVTDLVKAVAPSPRDDGRIGVTSFSGVLFFMAR